MQPPDSDPPRWSDSAANAPDELVARAFRREPPPSITDAALARIGRQVFAAARRPGRGWLVARTTVLVALVLAASGGVVAATRQVWRAPAREPQTLTVPANSRATITGRHRRRLTIVGPAALTFDPPSPRTSAGALLDVVLESGELTIEPGGETLSVRSGEVTVGVPGDGAAEISAGVDGEPAVKALSGASRVRRGDGPETLLVAAPARAPATPLVEIAGDRNALALGMPLPAIALAPAPAPEPQRPALATAANRPPPSPLQARRPVVVAPSPVAPAPPSTLSPPRTEAPPATPTEAASLATAFRKLRADGDPAAALAALDAHDRAFPTGWLRDEAELARAEALLALGRPDEALPLLEQPSGALTRNVRLTRAELLARAGHCPRAVGDFSDVLRARADDQLGERALAGRAACLLRAGRGEDARQDLARYLALFPRGPRADDARRLLAPAR
ncbi:MAG TPA: tetratricopeptide repeat protein [Polyangia bacterium]|nr:tetratricopeptide repeat protein [Polyangia bacterium]